MALVDRPTTTADAGGWTESPDQGDHAAPPEASPQTGTNGLDATGQALVAEDAPEEATEHNEPPRRPDGRFEKNGFRRRAASQQASAEDVPRIRALTQQLRQAERERDALRGSAPPAAVAPTAGTAPPGAVPAQAPPQEPPPPRPRQPLPPPPAFTLKEPTFDDFKDAADPLRDYTKAMARFTHAEEQHGMAVRYHQQEHAKAVAQADQAMRGMTQAHWQRMQAAAADPQHAALVAQFKDDARPITPAIHCAIVQSGEQSAHLTLALLRHPGLLEELTLATYDRPATAALVALVQRRLQSVGVSAAPTGSATPPGLKPAPRPPNPVRTAPDAPPRDLPGDDASLADHRAAFHRPRRSRLRRD